MSRKKAVLFLVPMLILVVGVLILTVTPGPIDAAAYHPPAAPPMTGLLAPNERLDATALLAVGQVNGPEDVAVDAAGRIIAADIEGRLLRIDAEGRVETWVETGGRTLGMDDAPNGDLIVCNSAKGLLAVSPSGEVTTLLTAVAGKPLGFTDDVDVASDGTIYFSDASTKFGQNEYKLDLMEARPYGRLIRYDRQTDQATVLLDDLYFANGVALSAAEDFVLVAETYRYRIQRVWLKGARAGENEIFIDNLPGFPDGISANGAGRFWVAFPTPRLADVDALHPHPRLKNLLARLPESLLPKPKRHGFVLALNEEGQITQNLQDTDGSRIHGITSVEEVGNALYFGTLYGRDVGRYRLD